MKEMNFCSSKRNRTFIFYNFPRNQKFAIGEKGGNTFPHACIPFRTLCFKCRCRSPSITASQQIVYTDFKLSQTHMIPISSMSDTILTINSLTKVSLSSLTTQHQSPLGLLSNRGLISVQVSAGLMLGNLGQTLMHILEHEHDMRQWNGKVSRNDFPD